MFNKSIKKIDLNNVPQHIAIIMDGNGRWAAKRGLPRTVGHKAGSETFKKACEYLNKIGVKYLTVYAFSTENWKRPQAEVDAILKLLHEYLNQAVLEMRSKNIHLSFLGDTSLLSGELKRLIETTDNISKETDGIMVNVCFNYGGRAEIVAAVAKLVEQGVAPGDITEERISQSLYTSGMPDPDLVIRPGGEQRISNFLLWQSAYSEYYFTDTLWPDMNEGQLDLAIIAYQSRNRRYGGV